jgi:hypothetical protein
VLDALANPLKLPSAEASRRDSNPFQLQHVLKRLIRRHEAFIIFHTYPFVTIALKLVAI